MNLKDNIIIFDGAMGTMLQKSGVTLNKVPEDINIENPQVIIDIHKQYIKAGADVIYANTFGANRYKVSDSEYSCEEIIKAAIKNAKTATENTNTKIALSIGPIGKMLEPNGDLSFEEAYDIYKEMIVFGDGADVIVFETMTDLLELKAAVLAAKENSDLPIVTTMTFESNMRTFTGVSVEAMATTLTSLGVDALGLNCSLGPVEIFPIAKKVSEYTHLPIVIKANAGLPNLDTNEYDVSAQDFYEQMLPYLDIGVSIIGGCCGTTPEYIELISKFKTMPFAKREVAPKPLICSASEHVLIDGVKIIGERINPTGKKLFKQALKENDMGYILTQGIDQVKAGANILDVNVGLPEIDEKEMMVKVVKELQSVLDTPLQIDSSNPEVIEAALRIYNGKPIVNSVNGEDAILDKILPLVKKYGAAVVGLTLDENGIPNTAQERFEIAKKIVTRANEFGIPTADVYIDCLTLTASVEQDKVMETLKAISMVKEKLGAKTVLGVSNISFGLPNRELINHSFLTLAMSYGLDLPIINPNVSDMVNAIYAHNCLHNYDVGCKKYIERFGNNANVSDDISQVTLDSAVLSGLKDLAGKLTKDALVTTPPLTIINEILIPALDKVGTSFEKGESFLPQLMASANAAQAAFDEIKLYYKENKSDAQAKKGKIILATVKGDIHDIGKNIVKVILDNYGYEVIDLGRDVPIEDVVAATKEHDVKLVGLSALMTTTVVNMALTIKALRKECDCQIMVGGAVLTEDYAMKIDADYYAKDAKVSCDIAKKIFG